MRRHEIYDPETNTLADASAALDADLGEYPWMFVLPEEITISSTTFPAGSVFFAGPETAARKPRVFDIEGHQVSAPIPLNPAAAEDAGSAVMYRPGKVLKCGGSPGGSVPGSDHAARIDFTVAGPYSWSSLSASP